MFPVEGSLRISRGFPEPSGVSSAAAEPSRSSHRGWWSRDWKKYGSTDYLVRSCDTGSIIRGRTDDITLARGVLGLSFAGVLFWLPQENFFQYVSNSRMSKSQKFGLGSRFVARPLWWPHICSVAVRLWTRTVCEAVRRSKGPHLRDRRIGASASEGYRSLM